jgi:hypothetical protein
MINRRDFLVATAGLVGAAVSQAVGGVACPPPLLTLDGTDTTSSACGGAAGLATLVSSMAANTWAPFTMGGLTASLMNPGGSPVITYLGKGLWDPIARKVIVICQAHGTNYESRELEWSESSNQWSQGPTPPVPDGSVSHGYYMATIDPVSQTRYWHVYGSHRMRRKNRGGSWSDTAQDNLDAVQITGGCEWNPHANGNVGGVVYGNIYGVATYNPNTNSWTKNLSNGSGITLGAYSQASFYDEASQCVFIGGGNGANTALTKITASGACSQVASAPERMGVPGTGSDYGGLLGPGWLASGGVAAAKPFLMGPSGAIYQYDTLANSWSGRISSRPYTSSDAIHFMTAIPTYGCVLFVYEASPNSFSAYVWKR